MPVVRVYNQSRNLVMKIYAWGKVVKIRDFDPNKAVAKAFNGAKWKRIPLSNLSKAKLNKFLSGRFSVIFNNKKR